MNCSRRTLRRNAKNAYQTGVKASSIAHAGSSSKKLWPIEVSLIYTLDLLSIPEYVIKKRRHHGHRYGKTPEKKEYHLAHNLKKMCVWAHYPHHLLSSCDFLGLGFGTKSRTSVSCEIHERFLRDSDFRKSMLEHDRHEDVCLNWDDLAEQDFTCRMSESEYFHYRQNWWISLNKSGNTGGPLKKTF